MNSCELEQRPTPGNSANYPGSSGKKNALGARLPAGRFGTDFVFSSQCADQLFAQGSSQVDWPMLGPLRAQQWRRGSNRMIFRHPARFPFSKPKRPTCVVLPAPGSATKTRLGDWRKRSVAPLLRFNRQQSWFELCHFKGHDQRGIRRLASSASWVTSKHRQVPGLWPDQHNAPNAQSRSASQLEKGSTGATAFFGRGQQNADQSQRAQACPPDNVCRVKRSNRLQGNLFQACFGHGIAALIWF